jgi:hypothetical protein
MHASARSRWHTARENKSGKQTAGKQNGRLFGAARESILCAQRQLSTGRKAVMILRRQKIAKKVALQSPE